ncbi:hypothetical protein Pla110_46330 [Polystyrenella longa]|uniref:DUF6677 domain-containing protein n=1 Tax=Polystyrenella longa TaxID=2528007 RepID=A0A518CUF5_9PLAN|nr:DUF6677 family protein [Polystyrenella longa]QDU82870.1 hypothetical protein Pla110_46330 [Polystyrenella longa]
MFDPRIPQKNRTLAAFLAFLVPGLGHYYQGRVFKASVYAVCIIGTYTYGMAMADGNGIYTHQVSGAHSMRNFPFLAQAGVGSVGLMAVIQSQRYFSQDFQGQNIYPVEEGLNQEVIAQLTYNNPDEGVLQDVPGQLIILPTQRNEQIIQGEFIASIDGQETRFLVAHPSCNEPALSAKETWTLDCTLQEELNGQTVSVGRMEAEIPRSFINEFSMPPEISTINHWYNKVGGKRYDLAVTLTMIAGLLNILAIWDCFDGPAHGYGDEESEGQPESKPEEKSAE